MSRPAEVEVGRLVLALDELLTSTSPAALAVAVDELADRQPTAIADQDAAARADVARLHARVGQLVGGEPEGTTTSALPAWVRLPLLDTIARWLLGRGSTCLHAPSPARPQPVLAAAWRPGLVTCLACAHLTDLPRGSVADRTCDRCGHVCAGPEVGDGVHVGAVTYGSVMFSFGVCGDCSDGLGAAA